MRGYPRPMRDGWELDLLWCGCGRGAARSPSSVAEMYGCSYVGDRASVRSREFGSVRPRRF